MIFSTAFLNLSVYNDSVIKNLSRVEKNIIISAFFVFILLGLYLMIRNSAPEDAAQNNSNQSTTNVLSEENYNVEANPVGEKVPELNPINVANPFKDSYKNPFE